MLRALVGSKLPSSIPAHSILPFCAFAAQPHIRTLSYSIPCKKDVKQTGLQFSGKAKQAMGTQGKTKTDTQKQKGSMEGKQYVVNTKAKETAKDVDESHGSDEKEATSQKIDYTSATTCTTYWEDPEHLEKNVKAYKTFQEANRKTAKDDADQAKKRGNASNNGNTPNKKQKSDGKDEPRGAAGSITRVPKKGQQVQWHSLPGYVDGEVVEVVYEEKEVDGKKVKASKEDPRVVLRSASSGKMCVHKPSAVYFEKA
jgi:hypothetical protein